MVTGLILHVSTREKKSQIATLATDSTIPETRNIRYLAIVKGISITGHA
jgi:hypothetical protein